MSGRGEFGIYFVGYAATPSVTEQMLANMFIGDPPGNYDRILDFSTANRAWRCQHTPKILRALRLIRDRASSLVGYWVWTIRWKARSAERPLESWVSTQTPLFVS
jgi:Dyp-type peroxidase, C-terminal